MAGDLLPSFHRTGGEAAHRDHGLRSEDNPVEPAASFVAHVRGRAQTIYVGAEEPANASAFTKCRLGKAGEVLPNLFDDV